MKEETRRDEAGTTGVRDKIRDTAAGLASSAKDKVEAQYEQKVESVLGEVSSIVNALRQAGEQLRNQNGSSLGAMALTTVADRMDSFRGTVDGKDLSDVAANVERFARRNPVAFMSTAAALGFLAVRFLKSSGRSHEAGLTPYEGFDSPYRFGESRDFENEFGTVGVGRAGQRGYGDIAGSTRPTGFGGSSPAGDFNAGSPALGSSSMGTAATGTTAPRTPDTTGSAINTTPRTPGTTNTTGNSRGTRKPGSGTGGL